MWGSGVITSFQIYIVCVNEMAQQIGLNFQLSKFGKLTLLSGQCPGSCHFNCDRF